jgi:hypothetical protein
LYEPLAVAKIDKNHTAVVTLMVHPPANLDLFVYMRKIQLPAVMTAHRTPDARFRKETAMVPFIGAAVSIGPHPNARFGSGWFC